jgi:hypothetical protein
MPGQYLTSKWILKMDETRKESTPFSRSLIVLKAQNGITFLEENDSNHSIINS